MQQMMLRRAALLLLPIALGGCQPQPSIKQAIATPSLQDTLGPAWTMVPLPNTKLGPGAIIQINPLDTDSLATARSVDLVWLGTLADCSVPVATLSVTSGAIPGISAGSNYSFDADLGAKLAQISLGASANASGTAEIRIDDSDDSSLDYISFSNWVAEPANAKIFDSACKNILTSPFVFVIEESFIISKGSYFFHRTAGGKIGVTPPPNVPVKAEVDANGGSTGTLTITAPVVFALKGMQLLPQGGFNVTTTLHHVRLAAPHALAAAAAPASLASQSPLSGKTVAEIRGLPAQ